MDNDKTGDDIDMSQTAEVTDIRKDRQQQQTMSESSAKWNSYLELVAERQDRQAFQTLFNHFAPLIKAFAYKVSSVDQGEAFADELVQETMFKVWTKSQSFNSSLASATTWIFTIARNTRIDLLRKQSRHSNNTVSSEDSSSMIDNLEVQDIWFEDAGNDVFDKLSLQRNKKVVHESLKDLPEEQSYILQKVYLEDKSHSQVAEELDLPLGTVKSRVRLALKKLKVSIDR